MTHTNICKSKEKDYFVLESIEGMHPSVDDSGGSKTLKMLKEMGMNYYLVFNSDGTVVVGHYPTIAVWNENSYTIKYDEEGEEKEMVSNFTIEGDVLTVYEDCEANGEPYVTRHIYRRSDEEAPDLNAPAGDKTVEIEVTDGFVTGRMSAYCPPGWHWVEICKSMGKIGFSASSPQDWADISIAYSTREGAKFTLEGEDEEYESDGKTWIMRLNEEDEENPIIELITYIGDSAIIIEKGTAYDDLQLILPSIQLTWDTEQSNCAICEEKEEDLFRMRFATDTGKWVMHGDRLCFRKDGTLSALLNKDITDKWDDDLKYTTEGTWTDGMITITNGEKTVNIPFKLEGDIITITLEDDYVITFRRCDE